MILLNCHTYSTCFLFNRPLLFFGNFLTNSWLLFFITCLQHYLTSNAQIFTTIAHPLLLKFFSLLVSKPILPSEFLLGSLTISAPFPLLEVFSWSYTGLVLYISLVNLLMSGSSHFPSSSTMFSVLVSLKSMSSVLNSLYIHIKLLLDVPQFPQEYRHRIELSWFPIITTSKVLILSLYTLSQ